MMGEGGKWRTVAPTQGFGGAQASEGLLVLDLTIRCEIFEILHDQCSKFSVC